MLDAAGDLSLWRPVLASGAHVSVQVRKNILHRSAFAVSLCQTLFDRDPTVVVVA